MKKQTLPLSPHFRTVGKKMKKKPATLLLGFMLLLTHPYQASAAAYPLERVGAAVRQTTTDQALILQKCIDLPELQQSLPRNSDGSYKTLNVMQHSISFPSNISVSHAGKPLMLISKGLAIGGTIESYFFFNQFQINEEKAWVEFVLYYDQTSSTPKMQVVSLQLEKSGSSWSITHSKIERREA